MVKPRQRNVPAVEWIAGLISSVIVLGTIGYLVFETVRPPSEEVALTVTVLGVRGSDGGFVVDIEVRNANRGAAADVHIAGRLRSIDSLEAQSQAHLDYVPGLSSRRASLVFKTDPGKDVEVRIVGYSKP